MNRVRHIGRCGLHGMDQHTTDDPKCNFEQDHRLFSKSPQYAAGSDPEKSVPQNDAWDLVSAKTVRYTSGGPNGGWGAKEDHDHCLAVAAGHLI